jgi:hypothetical protein
MADTADIVIDPSVLARMANNIGSSAVDIDVAVAPDVSPAGSQAVADALSMYSSERLDAVRTLRANLTDVANDVLKSANDYTALDSTYVATFQSFTVK